LNADPTGSGSETLLERKTFLRWGEGGVSELTEHIHLFIYLSTSSYYWKFKFYLKPFRVSDTRWKLLAIRAS
jgi:hypothetical protein